MDVQVWGSVLAGAVTLSLVGTLLLRKPKAKQAAAPRAEKAREPSSKSSSAKRSASSAKSSSAKGAAAKTPAAKASGSKAAADRAAEPIAPTMVSNAENGLAKALVWQVPQDDEDLTVLRAVPVFERPAEAASTTPGPAEKAEEDEKVSRIELSYEEDAEAEEVTAAAARILLYASGDSDRGRVRQRNEDCLLVMPERSLFAVADGMGGHAGGEVASRVAIDTLADAFHRSAFEGNVQAEGKVPRRARELAAAVHMTNECVRSMALADRALSEMGTTLVAARFSPNKQRVYIGHVGDSRCYRLRQGTLRQLTTDHTMASLGMKGPRSKDLYQAVGVSPGLSIDLIVDKPRDDDIYLLCSDGLSKMLSDDRIREVLSEQEDLESALYTLIEEANERGGTDNVTAIIVKILSRNSPKAMESLTRGAAEGVELKD